MIESFYLKEHLSFKEERLVFKEGLIVFSGPSGAGKSVFFNALLSVFGFNTSDAALLEAVVDNELPLEEYGIEKEDITIFKSIKQKSARYFVNSQNISQKSLKQLSSIFISYLSLRDAGEFENSSLLALLDSFAVKNEPLHAEKITSYKACYDKFTEVKNALEKVRAEESKINELKEFAAFEISKIEAVNPKIGEDEELMEFKKRLSKKEKIQEAIAQAEVIFESERAVNSALDLMGHESALFDEAMNFLRGVFESETQKINELEDIDVESILDRIEQISALKNRFGTIEEIRAHLEKRKEELLHYENISFEKKSLEAEFEKLSGELDKAASELSHSRGRFLKPLESIINGYLEKMYLKPCSINIAKTAPYDLGDEEMSVTLQNIDVKKVSSGEFNRLRLSFIAASNEIKAEEGGVLILDEIDSNLSGKESMSVANVLKEISANYQIFAISHHPQLSSCAKQHFFVWKKDNESRIKELDEEGRIEELSRMISGADITDKAREFAKSLRRDNR
ncbi:MAG: chromosome segregation protein SMC [Campylobacteraceae bacterium]|jgi:DNA repair protein RecN (Recombination protein N)|nr:chromosome segregation protein SMC [Campylobacteraceae bacterium]